MTKMEMAALTKSVPEPSPEAIRAARKASGLTGSDAGRVLGRLDTRGWSKYETGVMHMSHADFAVFMLLTGLHPEFEVVPKGP